MGRTIKSLGTSVIKRSVQVFLLQRVCALHDIVFEKIILVIIRSCQGGIIILYYKDINRYQKLIRNAKQNTSLLKLIYYIPIMDAIFVLKCSYILHTYGLHVI